MDGQIPDLVSRKLSDSSWIDLLPVGIYSCALDGRILTYNRHAVDIWGRQPDPGDSDERFCGAYRLFRLDGSELPHAETPMAEVLQTGTPVREERVEILRPDGTCRIVQVNIDPLTDDNGELAGAVNCFQDVTEIYRARQQIGENERRLHALLEALPAAIYTTDSEGRITFYNRAAVQLAGREPALGDDRWCVSWRLYWPDGSAMAHDECPMALALTERRSLSGWEAQAERPDGTRVPFLAYPTPLFDADGHLRGAVNMLVDITERKKAESDQHLLINELNHRVKNTLATVQSIARQTLRRAQSPAHFVESFGGRVDALAAAHTILTRQTWRGADLRELISRQLVLDDAEDGRVSLQGPDVTLGARAALHLALVLHELGTNARKYGALSTPSGRLEIAWEVAEQSGRQLHLSWRETGGPTVSATRSRGFGSTLIEKSLQAEGGEAKMVFSADGVRCEVRIGLPDESAVSEMIEGPRSEPRLAPVQAREEDALSGCRVLVVEDEPLLAMDLDAMLTDAGCEVVGPAQDYDTALAMAREAEADLCLLDANLAGRSVEEIAAVLTRRRIPFAFASGYGREGLPASFREAMLIGKPFHTRVLIRALRQLLDGRQGDGVSRLRGEARG